VAIDFNEIRELLAAIANTDISELTLKNNEFELTVRRGTTLVSPVVTLTNPAPSLPPLPIPEPAPLTEEPIPPPPNDLKGEAKLEEVRSPMVGTFYRTPAPDEPPYVEVGDRIRSGQVLCIIEAMKLMNEIESEISGQVMEILVGNGEPVEYGQVLMRVKI
jgi:acetyl-CoA carboxylase biotin carboxyl carrier protein